ncbi:MAG: ABC transporter permease subunit [Syntrophomonadaceae bacterium]|jgi:NitT/TauT family transport system permease protein|nr:ABC transporter permease subunit [Syntrophomonadaceae bacterium]
MKGLSRALAGIIIFLICWYILSLFINRVIVPSPAETLGLLGQHLVNPRMLEAALQTAWKVGLALVLVLLLGLILGLLLGLSETFYDMFRPIVMFIQAVPVVSWLSLVIFAWGVGWRGPIFITFVSLLPTAVLTTVSGIRSLDKDLLEMARVYRVPFKKVFHYIYLGSLLPFIAAIIDVTIGQAWKVVLVSEYLAGGSGLGVEIFNARMVVDSAGAWSVTLMACLLGIATERLVKYCLRGMSSRWGQA